MRLNINSFNHNLMHFIRKQNLSTKKTVCDTSTPFGCHVMKIGRFLSIVKQLCDEGKLKRNRDRWIVAVFSISLPSILQYNDGSQLVILSSSKLFSVLL